MANKTYRYQFQGILHDELEKFVTGCACGDAVVEGTTDIIVKDITLSEEQVDDLTSIMNSHGWEFKQEVV